MRCPHCQVSIHPDFNISHITRYDCAFSALNVKEIRATWAVEAMACPACKKGILNLIEKTDTGSEAKVSLIHPRHANRSAAPPDVPSDLAEDFNEACAVIVDSPKASAALSRRCLQGVLRYQSFLQKDLAPAIEAALASKTLPPALAENLDAIRNIGNFAAHPMKNSNTGEILPVEPHEAEWNLEVLEGLFDYFYVAPALAKKKRDALNAKLNEANKPPMK